MPGMNRPASVSAIVAPFHVAALDGLRGVAFLLVFADHSIPSTVPVLGPLAHAGWSGVELFFALSGFLVTFLLLREEVREESAGHPARFSVWRFWARRCLRIWPLYLSAIFLAFHVLPHLPSPWSFGPEAGSAAFDQMAREHRLPSWLFLMNWSVAAHGWPDTPFGVLWSVSVEEQFYLLLPLVLAATPRAMRRSLLVAAALAAFAVRGVRIAQGAPLLQYYVNTFMRADCFLAGAVLADIAVSRGGSLRPAPWWVAVAVPCGYCLNASLLGVGREPVHVEVLRFLLLDGIVVGAIWVCLTPGSVSGLLSRGVLPWIGTVSYGAYVWHRIVLNAVGIVCEPLKNGPRTGVYHAVCASAGLAITIGVAWISYRTIERPFLRWKDRLR